MGVGGFRVECPHCGSENPKSLIVTTCGSCHKSLDGAKEVGGSSEPPRSGGLLIGTPSPPMGASAPPRSAPLPRSTPLTSTTIESRPPPPPPSPKIAPQTSAAPPPSAPESPVFDMAEPEPPTQPEALAPPVDVARPSPAPVAGPPRPQPSRTLISSEKPSAPAKPPVPKKRARKTREGSGGYKPVMPPEPDLGAISQATSEKRTAPPQVVKRFDPLPSDVGDDLDDDGATIVAKAAQPVTPRPLPKPPPPIPTAPPPIVRPKEAPAPAPLPSRRPIAPKPNLPLAAPSAGRPAPPTDPLEQLLQAIPRATKGPMLIVIICVVVGLLPLMFIAMAIGKGSGLFTMGIIVVLSLVGVVIARAWATSSRYYAAPDAAPSGVAIGRPFTWGVTAFAKQNVVIGTGKITIKCEEHAIRRAGNSTSHHKRVIYNEAHRLAGGRLAPGQQANLRVDLTLPPHAMPTYRGRHNRIKWTVEIEAPVEGFCTDIKEKAELTVDARVESTEETGAQHDRAVPVTWLRTATWASREQQSGQLDDLLANGDKGVAKASDGSVLVSVRASDGLTLPFGPVIPAGETRELQVTLATSEDIQCRGVLCWIGCRAHGRGTAEEIVVFREQMIHTGPLLAKQAVMVPIAITPPPVGPTTYQGQHVKLEWMLRLRVDMPLWVDRRLPIPFIVTPRYTEPSE